MAGLPDPPPARVTRSPDRFGHRSFPVHEYHRPTGRPCRHSNGNGSEIALGIVQIRVAIDENAVLIALGLQVAIQSAICASFPFTTASELFLRINRVHPICDSCEEGSGRLYPVRPGRYRYSPPNSLVLTGRGAYTSLGRDSRGKPHRRQPDGMHPRRRLLAARGASV